MNVQNYFCDYFNLRRSMYSFEDPRFLPIAKIKGIPRSPSCLKLLKICYKLISIENQEKSNKPGPTKLSNNKSLFNGLKPVTETSSSQIIAFKNKKSSIGSINSVMSQQTYDWQQELDTFLKNFIFYTMEKLNDLADLQTPIGSTQNLIQFLELEKKYPGIEQSSTLDDFFNTVPGLKGKNKMTFLDLYIILTLCNLRYLFSSL